MSKEHVLVERLSEVIRSQGLQPGDRLPAERQLAPTLGVSRNTLRNTLRMLEARGLVRIRKSSGTYLHTRFMNLATEAMELRPSPQQLIADRFEAALLFLPIVAEECARRIGERQLTELQRCNMALSKSLLGGTTEPVWGESRNFFHLLAMGTKNELVVRIVELVCTISMSANELVLKLTRQEREVLFAYHVKILHALRERDGREAGRLARNYILHLGRYTEKYEHVRMKDSVYRAIREQEEEWETR